MTQHHSLSMFSSGEDHTMTTGGNRLSITEQLLSSYSVLPPPPPPPPPMSSDHSIAESMASNLLMDIVFIRLPFPIHIYKGVECDDSAMNALQYREEIESLRCKVDEISHLTGAQVHFAFDSISKPPKAKDCTIAYYGMNIVGNAVAVQNTRSKILDSCHLIYLSQALPIPLLLQEMVDEASFKGSIEEVTYQYGVCYSLRAKNNGEENKLWSIELTGELENVRKCKLDLSLLFDEFTGAYQDSLQVNPMLWRFVCEPYANKLVQWKASFPWTRFYYSPIHTFQDNDDSLNLHSQVIIFTTMDEDTGKSVKSTLKKTLDEMIDTRIEEWTLLCSKQKWNFLSCEYLFELESILYKYSIYASVSKTTEENQVQISFKCTNHHHLECGVNELIELLSDYQSIQFYLATENKLNEDLEPLARLYHLELYCHSNHYFEVFGPSSRLLLALMKLTKSPSIGDVLECRFNIELSAEVQDFVSGKKDGKLNKIMRETGVSIKLLPFHPWSFLLTIESESVGLVLQGYQNVLGELPSVTDFYIPEIHHKRIIGHGGKNIQKIMKEFGTYVKFLNAEEVQMKYGALSSALEYYPNVLVKTPRKNELALERMKAAILELSGEKDYNPISEFIDMPMPYQEAMLAISSFNGGKLNEYIKMSNSCIIWPESSDTLTLVANSFRLPQLKSALSNEWVLKKEVLPIESAKISHLKWNTFRSDKNVLALQKRSKENWKLELILPSAMILSQCKRVCITWIGPNLFMSKFGKAIETELKILLKAANMTWVKTEQKKDGGVKLGLHTLRRASYDASYLNGSFDFGINLTSTTTTITTLSNASTNHSRSRSHSLYDHSFKHFNSVLLAKPLNSSLPLSSLNGGGSISSIKSEPNRRVSVSGLALPSAPSGFIGDKLRQTSANESTMGLYSQLESSNTVSSIHAPQYVTAALLNSSVSDDGCSTSNTSLKLDDEEAFKFTLKLLDGLEMTDERRKKHNSLIITSIAPWKTPIMKESELDEELDPPYITLNPIYPSSLASPYSSSVSKEHEEELVNILRDVGMPLHYVRLLRSVGINSASELKDFNEGELLEIGIDDPAHRSKLLSALISYKLSNPSVSNDAGYQQSNQHHGYYQSRFIPSKLMI